MRTSTRSFVLGAIALAMMSSPLIGQGRVDRHVVFADQDGSCVMTAEPTQIRAQRGFVILWQIRNECGKDIDVEIGNFTLNGESATAPVETRSSTVPHGKQRTISGSIKADAMLGTYRYEILAGGQSQDPELVVDAAR